MAEAHVMARVVISGDIVEVYEYSSPILCGNERKYEVVHRDREVVDDEYAKRDDNLFRSRQTLRRIIWANKGRYTKFITLTYAQTVLDIRQVQRDITTFVQFLRRKGYKMDYVYVLENQKERGEKEGNEGCLHVHMLVFNDQKLPLDLLNKAWSHGYTDISSVRRIKDLGAYICKYITKDAATVFGRHVYGCSRGLKRPTEERFYSEGYSDTTYNGLHPDQVVAALDARYKSKMQYDLCGADGKAIHQTVTYYQGKWKGGNVIDENADIEIL